MKKLMLSCEKARELLENCYNFRQFEIEYYQTSEKNYVPDIYACTIETEYGFDNAYWEIIENKIYFVLV